MSDHPNVADEIRNYDWSSNPLGPTARWPLSLRTVVTVMLESAFPQCVVWGPQLITLHNDAFTPILGNKPSAIGRSFREVWAEAWDSIGHIVERAYAGESTYIEDFPLVINRSGVPEQAYFTFCYSPIPDDDGRVGGMLDTVVETTAKVRAENDAKLLNDELAHRIQNMFAVVTAIVDQTFRSGDSERQIYESLVKRIAVLGRAHEILTRSRWSTAPIGAVVEGALAPHRDSIERFRVCGPPLMLSAKQALALSLAIHELATNALKYGSLSVSGGTVEVCWTAESEKPPGLFRFTWTERDGPVVKSPDRKGFGSQMIVRGLASDFQAKVDLDYADSGLRFELTTAAANLGREV